MEALKKAGCQTEDNFASYLPILQKQKPGRIAGFLFARIRPVIFRIP
jgi:hypothetical protein